MSYRDHAEEIAAVRSLDGAAERPPLDLMQALRDSLVGAVRYTGMRHALGETTVLIHERESNGEGERIRSLPECRAVYNHSPDGFEWGYGGSGPSQLALALCIHVLGGDIRRATRVYPDVKFAVVARWQDRTWAIDRHELLGVIAKFEATYPASTPEPRTLASDLAEDR